MTREDQLSEGCLDYICARLCDLTGATRAAIMSKLFNDKGQAKSDVFPLVIGIQGTKQVPVVPHLQRASLC